MASLHAAGNGTTGACEAISHGLVSEDIYYRMLADEFGCDFVARDQIESVLTGREPGPREAVGRSSAWCQLRDGRVVEVSAPDPRSIARLMSARADHGSSPFAAIATPTALKSALLSRLENELAPLASNLLVTERPLDSARTGAGAVHGFLLASILAVLAAGYAVSPAGASLGVHLAVSLFFLSCVALRIAAAAGVRRGSEMPLERHSNRERPVYSVLVALHREAPVVPDLIVALKRLSWPKSKLEIKLVCEKDDGETLAALATQSLDARFEIIRVPPSGPRTKPKALAYALPLCTGTLVTLYDAEDRPHPHQIEEAWQRFRAAGPELAALQAPLIMANPRRNLLTGLFHLEYAGLFGGIVRLLARHDLPVPLGGTSTHFRRAAIEAVGGWDPYNVTEDADLGFRLWQHGYRTGVIDRPTLEDAPDSVGIWIRQRTRWIKGWLQTWIVQTRRPGRPGRRRRVAGLVTIQVLLAGTVVSTLFYPFTWLSLAVLAAGRLADGRPPSTLEILDWTNIALSFAAYAALCMVTVDRPLRREALRIVWATPAYWFLMSLAGWRAVHQFFRAPYLWEKTPHKAHERRPAYSRITPEAARARAPSGRMQLPRSRPGKRVRRHAWALPLRHGFWNTQPAE